VNAEQEWNGPQISEDWTSLYFQPDFFQPDFISI